MLAGKGRYGLMHVGGAYPHVAPPPSFFAKKSHVVSSLCSQKVQVHEASEEQIAMPGEKSLHFLPVSACRGGDTAAGRERTDQPNYQVIKPGIGYWSSACYHPRSLEPLI